MNSAVKAGRPADDSNVRPLEEAAPATANMEGEIREFVRRDVAGNRKQLPHIDGNELNPGNLNVLIERVSGSSIKELDHLIGELTVVRDYLVAEGERVQREVSNYAQVSQAAMASAKIILDSMGQWKTAVGSIRERA